MTDLPNGIHFDTAKYLIAWEIVRLSFLDKNTFINASSDDKKKLLTNALIDVYAALSSENHLGESD